MEQNLEIEFKNLLKKEEFDRVAKEFSLGPEKFRRQVNHYFDTPSFSLKEQGAALRIREKGGSYILTLKQPQYVGLLETDQKLTAKDAETAIGNGPLPIGVVAGEVEKMGIEFEELVYFGTLATQRAETNFNNGLIVLDQSSYLDTEDFELEYEVLDFHEGLEAFRSLLEKLGIPERKTLSKIHRFYGRKLQLGRTSPQGDAE
ncbi:CYTH domain-containing protein [Neobacillus piezotolerans]|uniref:CYTH domain-containing protein n=1 Tax=Neobacillus piezotolerans TaxID=2259171 RepID=A0A3D8GMG2_9BACI|nr:CYTH domain-containing protein [Neobacillus piezotolerans]RDU35588.1 CYTH domain-containing protein [Neobacillus piezotolerans]